MRAPSLRMVVLLVLGLLGGNALVIYGAYLLEIWLVARGVPRGGLWALCAGIGVLMATRGLARALRAQKGA